MVEVRPIRADQWQLLKAVRCAALEEAPYAFSSTLEDTLERSDDDWAQMAEQSVRDPTRITFFAFEDDVPCGMSACALDGDEVEMFGVWVDPAYRGQGVGQALIEFARAWAESHGAARLQAGVFEDNGRAIAFYSSAGFTDVGLTRPELSTEDRTVLLLTMELP